MERAVPIARTKLASGELEVFGSANQSFDAPATSGAVQVEFVIRDKTFADPTNLIDLYVSVSIALVETEQYTDHEVTSELDAEPAMRYSLSETVYFDLPLAAIGESELLVDA